MKIDLNGKTLTSTTKLSKIMDPATKQVELQVFMKLKESDSFTLGRKKKNVK